MLFRSSKHESVKEKRERLQTHVLDLPARICMTSPLTKCSITAQSVTPSQDQSAAHALSDALQTLTSREQLNNCGIAQPRKHDRRTRQQIVAYTRRVSFHSMIACSKSEIVRADHRGSPACCQTTRSPTARLSSAHTRISAAVLKEQSRAPLRDCASSITSSCSKLAV